MLIVLSCCLNQKKRDFVDKLEFAKDWKISITIKKTKVLRLGKHQPIKNVKYLNERIENVQLYTFLGFILLAQCVILASPRNTFLKKK